MKEQKEPRAVIMQSWIKAIRQSIPDKKERCDVYEYIFAEFMRIGHGVSHDLTKPDGVGGAAITFLLPQVEGMCRKYAENEEKRLQRIEEIKAKQAAKAAAKEAAKQDVVISERESRLNKMNDGSTTDM